MTIDTPAQTKSPVPHLQPPNRRQRVQRWANKGRATSIHNTKLLRAPHILKPSLTQKRAENKLFQYDRRLNVDLLQLGEQREKLIDQQSFNQKLFARKQLLLHKDDDSLLKTLHYVQKCCKLANLYDQDEITIDPITLFEEHEKKKNKIPRSRSMLSSASPNKQTKSETPPKRTLHYDPKLLPSGPRNVQSAFVTSTAKQVDNVRPSSRQIQTVHGHRSCSENTNEPKVSSSAIAPARRRPKYRSLKSKTFSTKSDIEVFRLHPERFLSKTNCYLPLLSYYATRMRSKDENHAQEKRDLTNHHRRPLSFSSSSSESNLSSDSDSFSKQNFLINLNHSHSKEVNTINVTRKPRPDRATLLARFRDHEYAHLNTLIGKNSIDHIIKPLSPMKTFDGSPRQQSSMNLSHTVATIGSKHY